jgi:hypothetical protein
VSGLNQVLTSNSVLLFLYLGRTANQRSISFGCIYLLLVQWHQVPFFLFSFSFLVGGCLVFTIVAERSAVFIAEEVDD